MPRHVRRPLVWLLPFAVTLSGCATLQQLSQLPQIDFHIDGARDADLAGIDIERLRHVDDLGPADLLRIAVAARRGQLPLRFDLHLGADNPSANRYDLRLERLDWTLWLEDKETVSGVFTDPLVIAPGTTTDIPIAVEVDLVRFFGDNARNLVDVALRAAGAGGPMNVRLRARPTLRTPLGLVRFPNEITIVSRRF